MYLPAKEVRRLVLRLQERFPGSELVCEVVNSRWLQWPFRAIVDFKLRRQLHLGEATFRSGIRHSREMEKWNEGIKFRDDWSYLDAYDGNLRWLRIFRHIGWIRYTQWTVHYRLG
jgi:O-methyltransferase involved in polyketide biosynthesis